MTAGFIGHVDQLLPKTPLLTPGLEPLRRILPLASADVLELSPSSILI